MPSVQLYLQAVPDCKSIVIVVIRFLSGDLGTTSLEVWKDEVLDQSIEVNNLVYKLPLILRYSVLPKNVVSQILHFVHSNMFVISPLWHIILILISKSQATWVCFTAKTDSAGPNRCPKHPGKPS